MRGKLGTGKRLDETHILLPQNVPAASGVTTSTGGGSGGSLFPTGEGTSGGTTPTDVVTPTTGNGAGGGIGVPGGGSGPSDIFGGVAGYIDVSIPATSALNLLGKIESQGIKAGTQLKSLNVKVDKLTGAQLQELLKKLPDGMTYELGVQKEQPK